MAETDLVEPHVPQVICKGGYEHGTISVLSKKNRKRRRTKKRRLSFVSVESGDLQVWQDNQVSQIYHRRDTGEAA